MGTASAPGKVILTGEHSVVYGKPAIAAALDLRCKVNVVDGSEGLTIDAEDLKQVITYTPEQLQEIHQHSTKGILTIHHGFDNLARSVTSCVNPDEIALKINIRSQLPIGAGLGSSAASAVATIQVAHGTPSGIDNSVATFGGIIRFEKGEIRRIDLPQSIPLVIANTGIGRNTKRLVAGVKSRYERVPDIMEKTLDLMAAVTDQIESALTNNDISYCGELFNINQGLLDAIGVNHPQLSKLIDIGIKNGGLGGKLTGAGGGGCLLILGESSNVGEIVHSLENENVEVYRTSLSKVGVTKGE
ncbi:MAG: mevalonate kinase family protein [Candidatus Kariarchaeaceae archaeon]|jgi:mevalonate kinase